MKNSSINLRISDNLRIHLEGIAKANGKSLSDFIRLSLEEKIFNEMEMSEEYEILKIKAEKIKESLKDNNWLYIEGEYSTIEIQYDDFEIDVNTWKSDYAGRGNVLISLKMYKDSNLILVTHLTNDIKFEIKEVLGKKTLFITKF